jgi:hypothetical protein
VNSKQRRKKSRSRLKHLRLCDVTWWDNAKPEHKREVVAELLRIHAAIEAELLERLSNYSKVPYTAEGLALVEEAVKKALDAATPSLTVEMLEPTEEDRANRVLRGVAIHMPMPMIQITGTVKI